MNTNFVSRFEAIDLDGLDRVSLMERTDKKFVVAADMIPELFQQICNDYFILEIDNERLLRYHTNYFDTSDDKLYTCHHNGKLNRFKVRKRTYLDTQISFLEVKFKTNKGKTIKKRIQISNSEIALNEREKEFLRQIMPGDPNALFPKSINQFRRITLVDKNLTERCTIDFDFLFESGDKSVERDDFVIIEIKQDRYTKSSKLSEMLIENRIKPTSFSKYCLGRAFAEKKLKRNSFKPKMRTLNKIIQN